MTVNERVEQLIPKVATNKSAFSSATGISAVIISHICSGRNKVSLAAITQILTAYPSVSTEWLVMGKGSMFKNESEVDSESKAELKNIQKDLTRFSENINTKIDAIITKMEV